MSVAGEMLRGLVAELKANPALAREVRAILGLVAEPAAAESEVAFEKVDRFASRIGMSKRSVWTLVRDGLPCVGVGRAKRVDVARALAWMRSRRSAVDDGLERAARTAYRRAAAKAVRT